MTEAAIEVVTPPSGASPLAVGQEGSVELKITSQGYRLIFIKVPLGDTAGALMTSETLRDPFLQPSSPEGVRPIETSKIENGTIGVVRIPFGSGTLANKFEFNAKFEKFTVAQSAGEAKITLHGGTVDSKALCDVTVKKSAIPPKIEAFTANSYNAPAGDKVSLDWTIKPEAKYELLGPAGTKIEGSGGVASKKDMSAGDYTLTVLDGSTEVDSRHLHIHTFGETKFGNYKLKLNGKAAGVLGLYARPKDGRLYALLRFGNDRSAQLWSTAHGFDDTGKTWRRETWSEVEWPPAPGFKSKDSIPMQVARRPGVIFRDMLWLMGGDCCHPDYPGSEFAYYDLEARSWQAVGEGDPRAWPKGMAKRMGHAVVAVPFRDRLWVMGGWSQNGGACGDIWEYNSQGPNRVYWTQQNKQWEQQCLFGATATNKSVWTAGGFASPGGTAEAWQMRRYDKDANKWEAPEDLSIKSDPLYKNAQSCASVLFALDETKDLPRGIATFYDNTYLYLRPIVTIEEPHFRVTFPRIEKPEGVLLPLDYYHMQVTVFQGAVFLRALKPRDMNWVDDSIHFLVYWG
jgi:Kelch motif